MMQRHFDGEKLVALMEPGNLTRTDTGKCQSSLFTLLADGKSKAIRLKMKLQIADPFMALKIYHSEKVKALRNILLCLSPLIFFALINSDWIARLLAVSGSFMVLNGLLFYNGFNPAVNLLNIKSKYYLNSTKQQREFRNNTYKGVLIVVGVLLLVRNIYFLIDCLGVYEQGKPFLFEINGRVKHNNMIFGAYFFDQSLVFEEENGSNIACHAIYYPHVFAYGKVYKLHIAPNSNVILDATNVQYP